MKNLLAGVAIVAFLMAINLVAAGAMLGTGKLMLLAFPDANAMWWPGLVTGLTGIAAGIGFGVGVMRLISPRRARSRVLGRG